MPWNKEFECMPAEKLQELQLEKLKETIEWVAKKVPFCTVTGGELDDFCPLVAKSVPLIDVCRAGAGNISIAVESTHNGEIAVDGH